MYITYITKKPKCDSTQLHVVQATVVHLLIHDSMQRNEHAVFLDMVKVKTIDSFLMMHLLFNQKPKPKTHAVVRKCI